jgi:hypothetical protein
MRRTFSLWNSTVGKKIMMAASGLILIGFVVGHMIGNLKVYQGRNPSTTTPKGCAPSVTPSSATDSCSG